MIEIAWFIICDLPRTWAIDAMWGHTFDCMNPIFLRINTYNKNNTRLWKRNLTLLFFWNNNNWFGISATIGSRVKNSLIVLIVWEFVGEGKERLWGGEKYRGKLKIFYIFWKSIVLESDKLMLMINIFLILTLPNPSKPSFNTIFLFLQMRRVLYFEEKYAPQNSSFQCPISFTYSFLFFSKSFLPFPSKLANKA